MGVRWHTKWDDDTCKDNLTGSVIVEHGYSDLTMTVSELIDLRADIDRFLFLELVKPT